MDFDLGDCFMVMELGFNLVVQKFLVQKCSFDFEIGVLIFYFILEIDGKYVFVFGQFFDVFDVFLFVVFDLISVLVFGVLVWIVVVGIGDQLNLIVIGVIDNVIVIYVCLEY